MDALVYEDTPLATYFEGEAIPYDLPRERSPSPSPTPFAPQGLPNFKRRLRKFRRSASSIAPGSTYTEELLERFRYILVASQLLSDDIGPRPSIRDHEPTASEITSLRGAVVTAVASFLVAWAIHWLKNRKVSSRPLTWIDLASYSVGTILLVAVATVFVLRLYTNYLQRVSVRTLSKYIDDSHNLDTTTSNVVRFIQEVEVVARGYELGSLLPPITRLEDKQAILRCQTLRRELAAALKLLTIIMVEGHNAVQPYINKIDVQRYHDIYEISLVEYSQAVELANHTTEDAQASLKELRFAAQLHSLARKVFLCDLLALQQTKGPTRFHQWGNVLRILREIEKETARTQASLSTVLAEEEWGSREGRRGSNDASSQDDTGCTQESATIKMQLRRFDDVAYSIRALNAKVHLLCEEVKGLTKANSEDAVISSALSKHYDSLGAELRNLLSDWERGRSTMSLSIETDYERASCSSSSVRTPISPSPSLGGLQIVDGGPADALRLLTGDSPSASHSQGIFEEEVFEAVASRPLPRKRMSIGGMTREEKIAKLAEERKKRATLQEQADTTTSMLRELQMVIKHRPKSSFPANNTPTTDRIRVASL